MRGWLVLAFLLLSTGGSSAAIDAVNIYEPRRFGHFIGDTLERRVEVITSGDTELFTAALPRPGPLTYWLDLVSIEHKSREDNGRRIYDITLKYQIFYSALEAKRLDIPAFPLRFKNPGSVSIRCRSTRRARRIFAVRQLHRICASARVGDLSSPRNRR